MKGGVSLIPVVFTALICVTSGMSAGRYHALKFGETIDDYVMFQHDMSPFQTEFTLCAWIRKLSTVGTQASWFDYYAGGQDKEIQMSDNGKQTSMFGSGSDISSKYTVTKGTWFHNCLAWSAASQTRDVYIDGVLVDSEETPARRTVNLGGNIVLGNEQESLGGDMDAGDIFGGELYKLNMFNRKLDVTEIMSMAANMCTEEENTFGESRKLKWEDVILKYRYGKVTEKISGCETVILQQTIEKLNNTTRELNKSQAELLRVQEERALNVTQDCILNNTTSHWDLLDYFKGSTFTDRMINLFIIFQGGDDEP